MTTMPHIKSYATPSSSDNSHSAVGMPRLSRSYFTLDCPKKRALQGAILGVTAPLGWLILQLSHGAALHHEVATHSALYLYMLCGASLALAAFGWGIGQREESLEHLNERLAKLSLTDHLTSLKNSRYFWPRFDEALAESRRSGTPVSLVLFDLDHFKRVNDSHGHAVGDRVLTHVGRVLNDVVRRGETAARIGGEEFAVLMPRASEEEARNAAERIRAEIAAQTFEGAHGMPLKVTMSAGIVSTERVGGGGARELYRLADAALYESKGLGRDCVSLADETSEMSGDLDLEPVWH